MGQKGGCCSKQIPRDLGRNKIPNTIMNKIQQPIIHHDQTPLPNPYSPEIYGQFHCEVHPKKYICVKMPANPLEKTKFVWSDTTIWTYPIEKIRSLTVQQIRKRTFQEKYTWFRSKLEELKQKYQSSGSNKIKVDAKNVLFSSYQSFQKTKIVFDDDKTAIDAGGLFREWVNLCLIEAFSEQLGMFKLCQTDQTAYKIKANRQNKQVFAQIARILGFVIGKSLIQKIPLNCYFNRTIFRILSNQPIYLNDMYNYDMGIYYSLKSILQNQISQEDLISFSTRQTDPFTGKHKQYQLVQGGKQIFVNDSNKDQFAKLMIKFYTYDQIRQIIEGLKYTLYQVIPYCYFQIFEPHEFEMILCGRQEIDIKDWKNNTNYKGYNANDPLIVWFWEIVETFDQQKRANLLHYCTGSTKVPVQGFKNLECKRGKIKHFNIKCVALMKENPYPKGITCFNRLQLPQYSSKQQLFTMLTAITQQKIHYFGLDGVKH